MVQILHSLSSDELGLIFVVGSFAAAGLALAALFWVPTIRRILSGQLHRLD